MLEGILIIDSSKDSTQICRMSKNSHMYIVASLITRMITRTISVQSIDRIVLMTNSLF